MKEWEGIQYSFPHKNGHQDKVLNYQGRPCLRDNQRLRLGRTLAQVQIHKRQALLDKKKECKDP